MPEAMWASEPHRLPDADRGGFIYASIGGTKFQRRVDQAAVLGLPLLGIELTPELPSIAF
jgi:hypothetical protein